MQDYDHLVAILGLAFGLGMLHALDADHIMAVSGLSSLRGGFRDTLRFCFRWSMGHGLILLLLGVAVMFLGMAIPVDLSQWAEHLVGIVLILIGLYVLQDLFRQHAHFHFHAHDGLPEHAHWHQHNLLTDSKQDAHLHKHGALMVGMLHGTAGSAPLLALMPLSVQSEPVLGLSYLLLFGMGVLTAMLLFGGVLGSFTRYVLARGETAVRSLRTAVALGSVSTGCYFLLAAGAIEALKI